MMMNIDNRKVIRLICCQGHHAHTQPFRDVILTPVIALSAIFLTGACTRKTHTQDSGKDDERERGGWGSLRVFLFEQTVSK